MTFEIAPLSTCAALLLHRLLKTPAEEIGNILGLYIRQYRENLEQIAAERQRIGEEQHLDDTDLRSISPKFGTLWLMGAILEDDKLLQELWGRLLTNAESPNFNQDIRTAFIDIIKGLSPVDVRVIRWLQSGGIFPMSETEYAYYGLPETLKLDWNEAKTSIDNLKRLNLIDTVKEDRIELMEANSRSSKLALCQTRPYFTSLGSAFLRACVTGGASSGANPAQPS